jgi:hypothetical protein
MCKRILMVSAIGRPGGVIGVNLKWCKEENRIKNEEQVTLVGVLGQGALISFFLGR